MWLHPILDSLDTIVCRPARLHHLQNGDWSAADQAVKTCSLAKEGIVIGGFVAISITIVLLAFGLVHAIKACVLILWGLALLPYRIVTGVIKVLKIVDAWFSAGGSSSTSGSHRKERKPYHSMRVCFSFLLSSLSCLVMLYLGICLIMYLSPRLITRSKDLRQQHDAAWAKQREWFAIEQ